MNLLALDTSSLACSVALGAGGALVERHALEPKEHTRLLLPMIRDVLRQAGLGVAELNAVVLGNGPGSFIGLRIGASVAQGLCYGAGLKLAPVSSLAAVAAEAFGESDAECVLVAQDAHREEVYLGRFRRGEDALAIAEGATVLHDAAGPPIGDIAADVACHAAGDGWRRYPELLARNAQLLSGFIDVRWPRARFLLEPGRRALLKGEAIDPRELVPAYVRERVTAGEMHP